MDVTLVHFSSLDIPWSRPHVVSGEVKCVHILCDRLIGMAANLCFCFPASTYQVVLSSALAEGKTLSQATSKALTTSALVSIRVSISSIHQGICLLLGDVTVAHQHTPSPGKDVSISSIHQGICLLLGDVTMAHQHTPSPGKDAGTL
ncbi:hypothetical protein CRUP_016054, partial [Coryphaenoides rupestris]